MSEAHRACARVLLTSGLVLDVKQRAFIDSRTDCAHGVGVYLMCEPLVGEEGGGFKTRLIPYEVRLSLFSWRCRQYRDALSCHPITAGACMYVMHLKGKVVEAVELQVQ